MPRMPWAARPAAHARLLPHILRRLSAWLVRQPSAGVFGTRGHDSGGAAGRRGAPEEVETAGLPQLQVFSKIISAASSVRCALRCYICSVVGRVSAESLSALQGAGQAAAD